MSRTLDKPRPRVAVVGSGIAGLSAAWALNNSKSYEVHIYEASKRRLGGHINTVPFSANNKKTKIDTNFVTLNAETYPNFLALLDHVGVKTEPTEASFSFSDPATGLEYSNSSFTSLFAQHSNLTSPRFWRLLFDIARFNLFAHTLLSEPQNDYETLETFLARHHYSSIFTSSYLLPLLATIRRTPVPSPLSLPAQPLIRLLTTHNHLSNIPCHSRPPWLSIVGGAKAYISALTAGIPEFHIHLSTPVTSIGSTRQGKPYLKITDPDDPACSEFEIPYDHIICATSGDEALKLLVDPTKKERGILGTFETATTPAVLHSDASRMPKNREVWSAGNYHAGGAQSASVTFSMNVLQHVPRDTYGDVLVTVNPQPGPMAPAKDSVQAEYHFRHPVITAECEAAKRRMGGIQGVRGVWYAGAWMGDGAHEDACRTGLRAAEMLGVRIPWGGVVETGARGGWGWMGEGVVMGVVAWAVNWVVWWVWWLEWVWEMVEGVVESVGGAKKKTA